MKLGDYLQPQLVLPDLKATSKTAVLQELVSSLADVQPELDVSRTHKILLDREQLGTTGIGEGVAIPHGKLEQLEEILLIAGRSRQGVDFDALDHEPCRIFFVVLAPEQAAGTHLRILAHISRLLKDEAFRDAFLGAEDNDALWELLKNV